MAPWAAKRMKGFLSENERVLYSGSWLYGFFSLTAVGAYNIGSIKTNIENVMILVVALHVQATFPFLRTYGGGKKIWLAS